MSTLLGRPVHQLVNANISSANHVAATKCKKKHAAWSRGSAFFRPNFRIKQKYDLSAFDCGMIVDARQGGLSISGTVSKHTTVSRVNERGQRRRARLVKADRKVTVTQITTYYNRGMQKSISEHTTRQIT